MSDVLVSDEVRVSVAGVHARDRAPDQRPRQSAAMKRAKTALAQFDENLRLRPLPSVALALALGFIAARLASR
jgi:ElaB/YqjD/DUF883 family membrane-anchored ribosome-binding protein